MINNQKMGLSFAKEQIWSIAITIFFAVNMNCDWSKVSIYWYGSVLLVMVAYVIVYDGLFQKVLPSFFKWFLSFMGLCVLSLVWSLSVSPGIDVIKIMIVLFVMMLFMQFAINRGYNVSAFLKCYFYATAINMIYVFMKIDVTQLGETQLGTYVLDGWNGNGIGFMMVQGALVGIYLLGYSKEVVKKTIFLAGTIAFAYLTMCTGSRTAFIMLVACLVMFYWLSHPTKMVRNIIVTIALLIGAFYLIMNVEIFYNVLGSRFEGLFALFSGKGKVDGSADIRDVFIQNGKRWFLEEPFLGYGINNYRVLNKRALGRYTYAHNTFIELAVDLGIVGLFVYYSVYVYLGWNLLKNVKNRKINAFLLSWLMASLISQYGTVSYYDLDQNFLIMMCFYAVNSSKKERDVNII